MTKKKMTLHNLVQRFQVREGVRRGIDIAGGGGDKGMKSIRKRAWDKGSIRSFAQVGRSI